MHITQIQNNLKLAIEHALKNIAKNAVAGKLQGPIKIELEIPKDYKHGDLTTNVAMRLAKNFSVNSVKLASLIKEELGSAFGDTRLGRIISKIEVLPPGFINFWFSTERLYEVLTGIQKEAGDFGRSLLGGGEKVNIEFVSANPTGPLTIAHARQAAVGDALGRILEFSGYKVCREYFINDVGTQIELLGKSIHARYATALGADQGFPEDGYHGGYINDLAKEFNEIHGNKFLEKNAKNTQFIAQFGVGEILKGIRTDLAAFRVSFDKWSSQQKISAGKIKNTLNKLEKKGYVYNKDGAIWFKSTAFGDDKDRVVVKKDGSYTYLAPDIAYHLDKFRRKFKKLIDIWGPDHHGYIARLVASMEAFGYRKDSISILIVQLATLFRGGVALSMSTRKGEFITLKEIVDEVGCDVAKFFFLMRKLDSHLDFDLALAKKSSHDNPVYYIQYAHARIASIMDFGKNLKGALKNEKYNADLLDQPEELLILRMLSQFPLAVEASAKTLEPYRLVSFLNDFAKSFHSFYTKHRVVRDDDLPRTKARLVLINGVKIVLANGLGLLGISFPDRM